MRLLSCKVPTAHPLSHPQPHPGSLNRFNDQGEDIRLYMQAIPRDSDPIPLIHVYVDLHLLTLQDAGLLNAPEGGQATLPNTARSFREADKVSKSLALSTFANKKLRWGHTHSLVHTSLPLLTFLQLL